MIDFNRITTKSGDDGKTELPDGRRVRKDDVTVETLGSLDAFISYLGLIRAIINEKNLKKEILGIQKKLLIVCSRVAGKSESLPDSKNILTEKEITNIENMEKELLKKADINSIFTIPGTTVLSAHIDFARTLCREVERRVVTCIIEKGMDLKQIQRYLNRLSDYLFILARYVEKNLP